MDNTSASILISFLPLILMSLVMAIAANLLAREKGRSVTKWTILALIPIVNFGCIWFFIGATNLNTERKLDEILKRLDQQI